MTPLDILTGLLLFLSFVLLVFSFAVVLAVIHAVGRPGE